MKTILQKTCFGLIVAAGLFFVNGANAQIEYYEDFSAGNNGWTNSSFQATTDACTTAGALRARINAQTAKNQYVISLSPNLGVSNGDEITLTYAYRLMDYNQVLPTKATDAVDFGALVLEYATSANGPWNELDRITVANYIPSTECIERIASFTPPADRNIYLRFRASTGTAINTDYYVYVDEVTAVQGLPVSDSSRLANTLKVHPVPGSDYLNIEYDGYIDDVAIFNMQGQQVTAINMDEDFGRLDISGLEAGEYIIKVKTNNILNTVTFVKN